MMVRTSLHELVQGGRALAALDDGKTLLVDGALPGEEVEVALDKRTSHLAMAHVVNIRRASPLRRIPPCPYFDRCGGCGAQYLKDEAQPQAKAAMVRDNLRRLAKVDGVPEDPVACGPSWGWRIRVRFHVDLGRKTVGFFSERSHEVVPLDGCPVLDPRLGALLADKRRLLEEGRKAMFAGRGRDGVFEVPCFCGDEALSFDDTPVRRSSGDVVLWASARVFFQSNPYVLAAMGAFVRTWAKGTLLDLYSGVGTLSAFAGPSHPVTLVERQPECRNLARRNVPWGKAFSGDAGKWKEAGRPDTVLVDPPRVGLDAQVPALIASWRPSRILYLSCNSVTLARDVERICRFGYRPVRLAVFDMYPQTWEQEAGLVLEKE